MKTSLSAGMFCVVFFLITVGCVFQISSNSVPCDLDFDIAPCTCSSNKESFREIEVGLVSLSCDNVKLGDVEMGRLLNAFVRFYSKNPPFFNIYLNDNGLTRIPLEIPFIGNRLLELSITNNDIISLHNGDINCPMGGKINISSNQLTTIEEGAFRGDYCWASTIDLSRNKLTLFEFKVFRRLLSSIHRSGFVDISQNPIDCETDTCHLAWLIRDNPNLLQLTILRGAVCSNGTDFYRLSRSGFNTCPPEYEPA